MQDDKAALDTDIHTTDYLSVDQGSNYTSLELNEKAEADGIALDGAPMKA